MHADAAAESCADEGSTRYRSSPQAECHDALRCRQTTHKRGLRQYLGAADVGAADLLGLDADREDAVRARRRVVGRRLSDEHSYETDDLQKLFQGGIHAHSVHETFVLGRA